MIKPKVVWQMLGDIILERFVYDFRLFRRDWRTVKDSKTFYYWPMLNMWLNDKKTVVIVLQFLCKNLLNSLDDAGLVRVVLGFARQVGEKCKNRSLQYAVFCLLTFCESIIEVAIIFLKEMKDNITKQLISAKRYF